MAEEDQIEAIAFIGDVLAPFFLQDPVKGDAAPSFAALAALDTAEAATDWPFVSAKAADEDMAVLVRHAANPAEDGLVWEYRRLFVGPNKKPAPPWGSVYTDRECVVFGESTLALRAWMRAHGVERTSDERTPEDHIGLMLGLLGWLARERPELVEEYLRDHLLTWSSHYLGQLEDAAEHPFYESLARLTRKSLEGIRDELGIAVAYPKYYR